MSYRPHRIALALFAALLASVASLAESPDLNAAARQLVQRLVLDRAATVVAMQRRADAREQKLLDDLGAKDRLLRAELRQRRSAEQELARVTAQREQLIAQISERDAQLGAEISSYRMQMVSLAGSSDPRKRVALQAYADGDRAGAIDALIELQRADTNAVAAGWRAIGALALDRRDRGEGTTASVIAIFSEAQKLDPTDMWGWIEIARLQQDAGDLGAAKAALEQAASRVGNPGDEAVVRSELGNVLLAAGDLTGAKAAFERNLELNRAILAAQPDEGSSRRNTMIALDQLANLERRAGALDRATALFDESVKLGRELLATEPGEAANQRALSTALDFAAEAALDRGDRPAARKAWLESLAIADSLSKDKPQSLSARRGVSVTALRLGLLEFAGGTSSVRRSSSLARSRCTRRRCRRIRRMRSLSAISPPV